ncbi:ATP-binding cassette domain-containing protein [Dactylosporangium darangshiense]|uniref:ATP-binding cassette domain-containing protein n=1 Tax=Dactylosporangium darangshiense TaxID=579108 RepID=UPI00362D1837
MPTTCSVWHPIGVEGFAQPVGGAWAAGHRPGQAIVGLLPTASGSMHLDRTNITTLPAYRRSWAGIGYVPQGRGLFPASPSRKTSASAYTAPAQNHNNPRRDMQLLPVLHQRRKQPAGTLSGGEQQQFAIVRALVGRPAVLILAEPSEGIQPNLVTAITDRLKSLATRPLLGRTPHRTSPHRPAPGTTVQPHRRRRGGSPAQRSPMRHQHGHGPHRTLRLNITPEPIVSSQMRHGLSVKRAVAGGPASCQARLPVYRGTAVSRHERFFVDPVGQRCSPLNNSIAASMSTRGRRPCRTRKIWLRLSDAVPRPARPPPLPTGHSEHAHLTSPLP